MVDTMHDQTSSSSVTRDATQRGASGAAGARERMGDIADRGIASNLSNVDVKATIRDLQERSREYIGETERYIRANPMGAVLGAAGIGLLMGFLLRRSWA
jgi:ElaB/YqjD/DUF883 family membrane-anchored ribosome-binding protein